MSSDFEGRADARVHGRAALAVVRSPRGEPRPTVWFCSHCGSRPEADVVRRGDRLCAGCGLGLLLGTSAWPAPESGDAFMVVDRSLSVCAVSAGAERLLATRETDAVNRHVTELLVPADAEAPRRSNLASTITWAASGDDTARRVFVRPANVFGVRIGARITSCIPPRAALLVFD